MNLVIVVAHQKGGVGKSTIVSNLATELSKKLVVNVVDLDVQRSLSYFNSIRKNQKLNITCVDNFNELKNIINNNKNVLIIDVGGFDSDLNRGALLGADIIITPVGDSAIELVGLLSFKETLQKVREARPELQASILLNRIHSKAGSSVDRLRKFINENAEFKVLNTVLRDRAEFKKAFEHGLSVIEHDKQSKAATEIKQLIKELL